MNNLFTVAQAEEVTTTTIQTEGAEGMPQQQSFGEGLMGMLPIIIIFVVFMLFMSNSQKKQAKKRMEAINQIMKGDRVMTNGGIYGNIAEVNEDTFILEIASNVKIEIAKSSVSTALPKVEK